MTTNGKTVAMNLKRVDLCDLMLACTALDSATDENTTKWANLHDKLAAILDKFDKKNEI